MNSRKLVLLAAIGAAVGTVALLILIPPLRPRGDGLRNGGNLELRPGTRFFLDGPATLVLAPEGVDALEFQAGGRLELRVTAEGVEGGPRFVPLKAKAARVHVKPPEAWARLRVSKPE